MQSGTRKNLIVIIAYMLLVRPCRCKNARFGPAQKSDAPRERTATTTSAVHRRHRAGPHTAPHSSAPAPALTESHLCSPLVSAADLLASPVAMSGADFSLTTFSPSGKLVQIEYALNAVNAGKTSLGIKGEAQTIADLSGEGPRSEAQREDRIWLLTRCPVVCAVVC